MNNCKIKKICKVKIKNMDLNSTTELLFIFFVFFTLIKIDRI